MYIQLDGQVSLFFIVIIIIFTRDRIYKSTADVSVAVKEGTLSLSVGGRMIKSCLSHPPSFEGRERERDIERQRGGNGRGFLNLKREEGDTCHFHYKLAKTAAWLMYISSIYSTYV